MKLAIIVAAARNGVIGRNNQLPWHLPQDLKYFKAQTLGKPVIMGRKTYESIGKPLPGRVNIVVTRRADWPAPDGVVVANNIDQAILHAEKVINRLVNTSEEAMVIGGAEIYAAVLPKAQRIYLTRIEEDIQGDAAFVMPSDTSWQLSSSVEGEQQAPIAHKFLIYDRI